MNNILLNPFFQQQTNGWFLNGIENYKSNTIFTYDIDNISNIIKNIIKHPFKQKQILYLIYSIFKNNNFDEPFGIGNDNGRPFKYEKYAFQGNHSKEKNGVYHAHIDEEDEDIIVWYFTLDYDSILTINFEYMIHPKNYNPTLKRIYNVQHGFNVDDGEMFENDKYLLENKILKFNDFLNEIKTSYLNI